MALPSFFQKVFKSYGSTPLLKPDVGGVPLGVPIPFCGDSASIPSGYLLCDGSAISRTTYASLFSVIGTSYGTGDGSTTFNLPDGNGRTFQGGSTRGHVSAGLPNITGQIFGDDRLWLRSANPQGAFSTELTQNYVYASESLSANGSGYLKFDASDSNSIYGNSTTVQPPAIVGSWIIRYQ